MIGPCVLSPTVGSLAVDQREVLLGRSNTHEHAEVRFLVGNKISQTH